MVVTVSIPDITCGGRAKGGLVAPGADPMVDPGRGEVRVDAAGIAPLLAALRAGGRNAAPRG